MSSGKISTPLPPGVERRRRLRQERRRERIVQSWRFGALTATAACLGWVLLAQGWTLHTKEQMVVEGSQRLGRDAVIEAAQMQFPLRLLSLQPSQMETTLLKQLPVQAVTVQRRLLPPGLMVTLEDRRPLASATRVGRKGVEKGMVDGLGHWMAHAAVGHGEEPETSIQVKGWAPAQRPALAMLLEQRDQLGSPLQTINIAADGNISLTTAGLGLVQLGTDPGLLEQQLTTMRQLSRSLPADLKRQPGSSIDLSDPAKPELQLPAPPQQTETKASER